MHTARKGKKKEKRKKGKKRGKKGKKGKKGKQTGGYIELFRRNVTTSENRDCNEVMKYLQEALDLLESSLRQDTQHDDFELGALFSGCER